MDISILDEFEGKWEGVKIGTADTGIDITHNTFKRLREERRLKAFASFDQDGKKYYKLTASIGHELSDEEAMPKFYDWHGTHTAAILVGDLTDGKKRGIATEAEIFVAQVTNYRASHKAAFRWLSEKNCDIVSLSLGEPGKQEVWEEEISSMIKNGAVVVAAAGNEFIYSNPRRSPANYPIEGLISVGALDREKKIWFKSGGENFKWPEKVFNANGNKTDSVFRDKPKHTVPIICAPGVDIISAAPYGAYHMETGTSMVTPHVAGLIARVLSIMRKWNQAASPFDAASLVLDSLLDLGDTGHDVRFGRGLISIDKVKSALKLYKERL